MELEGKIALVTGGASGIGRATVELFLKEGASVVIADLDIERGEELTAALRGKGLPVSFQRTDVSNSVECEAAVSATVARHGRIDILFNNAGITRRANVIATSETEWDRVMAVNVKSIFLMCKLVVPIMVAQGGGSIVNTASGWGIVGGKDAVSYCASKGAVVLLTKAMAIDHGPDKVRVNCVCPGDTDTPMLRSEAQQLGMPDFALVEAGSSRPLMRVGQASEIAQAVLFLASDRSSFVTGDALVVDGGGLAGSA